MSKPQAVRDLNHLINLIYDKRPITFSQKVGLNFIVHSKVELKEYSIKMLMGMLQTAPLLYTVHDPHLVSS